MITDDVNYGAPLRVDLEMLINQNVVLNFLSVTDDTNNNLAGTQNELLAWHSKLAHSYFDLNQSFMRNKTSGLYTDPIIKTSKYGVSSCDISLFICFFLKW